MDIKKQRAATGFTQKCYTLFKKNITTILVLSRKIFSLNSVNANVESAEPARYRADRLSDRFAL